MAFFSDKSMTVKAMDLPLLRCRQFGKIYTVHDRNQYSSTHIDPARHITVTFVCKLRECINQAMCDYTRKQALTFIENKCKNEAPCNGKENLDHGFQACLPCK